MASYFIENTFVIMTVLGVLAFIVLIATEMIKDLWFVKKLPTKLTALMVSAVVVVGAMTLYLNMAEKAFVWWYLVAAFFAAFIVGYLSINGWDTLFDIWTRFVPGSKEEDDERY